MKPADKAKVIEAITATITDQPTCWTEIVEAVKATGVTVKDWREVRNFLYGMMQEGKFQRLPTINSEAYVIHGAHILRARTTGWMMAKDLKKYGYKCGEVVEPTDTTPGRVDITDDVYVEVTMTALSMNYKDGEEWKRHDDPEPMEWAIEIIDALSWLVYRYPQHANIKAD